VTFARGALDFWCIIIHETNEPTFAVDVVWPKPSLLLLGLVGMKGRSDTKTRLAPPCLAFH